MKQNSYLLDFKFLCFNIFLMVFAVLEPQIKAQTGYDMPVLPTSETKEDTLSISIIGDVMMHSAQLEYDYKMFFSELDELIGTPELCIANMEFTLAGEPYSGYPAFSAPDGYASHMAEIGIDVFLTANNHILDKGDRGFSRTLEVYEKLQKEKGTFYTGTADNAVSDSLNNPLMVRVGGICLGLINFSYGTNIGSGSQWPAVRRMRKDDVALRMQQARDRGADYIIVLPHWGTEYQLKHSAKQEEWARFLVENGADVIVGSHPHVVQDTTHIDGVPVIYSLGNAVSNMSADNTRLELAVKLQIVKHADGLHRMLEPELIWLWCTLPGRLKDNYCTIPVKKYIGKRELWKIPSDYDNMITTYQRVLKATGINEKND